MQRVCDFMHEVDGQENGLTRFVRFGGGLDGCGGVFVSRGRVGPYKEV